MSKMQGRAIYNNLADLSEEAVRRQYDLEKDKWQKYGEAGRQKALTDARYHLVFLAEALIVDEPSLFGEYVSWLKVLFNSLGFDSRSLENAVRITVEVARESLGQGKDLLKPFLEAGLLAASSDSKPTSFVAGADKYSRLSRLYLDLVLGRNRSRALELITDEVAKGTPVGEIYLRVFQPVQREIGRLWQTGNISVAEEHYSTAITQLIMSQLYPRIFATPRKGCRMVAVTVEGEYHEMGIRMVCDLFELDGWDTYFLGASTPENAIIAAVHDWQPDLVAVSATMTFNVSKAARLIEEIKNARKETKPAVIVGGLPFNVVPRLWEKLGADGYAGDGRQAVIIANQIACNKEPYSLT